MRKVTDIEVQTLLERYGETLRLNLVSDWGGLDRKISGARVHKAGLSLAGFVKHVQDDLLVVFGLTEIDFLLSLEPALARANLEAFCARKVPVIVLTRDLEAPPILLEICRQAGIAVASTPLLTAAFISGVSRVLEDWLALRASVHGVLIDVLGVGILLIGRSGVGKSEAALDLVLKGHRLVADDVVEVSLRPPQTIWGAATQVHQHHMEIRGMGVLNITHLFGVAAVRDAKKVEVVVELSDLEGQDYDRLGTERNVWPILGVEVPLVRIPLRPGRNIASLIEVVARNQLLKFRGHDSAREFQEKIAAHIQAQTAGPTTKNEGTSGPNPLTELE